MIIKQGSIYSERKRAYNRLYVKTHPEKVRLNQKKYKSKESYKIKLREHQKTQKYRDKFNSWRRTPKYREYVKKYRQTETYKLYMLQYNRKYYKHKSSTDVIYKLKCVVRSRIKRAIEKNYKRGLAINSLGCSIEQLKMHLENQFTDNMSWNNYGKWQIDHIVPLAIFDLTNTEQLKVALHYSNLQPLWAEDNYKKGSKII